MVRCNSRQADSGEEHPAEACSASDEADRANEKLTAPSEGRTVRGRQVYSFLILKHTACHSAWPETKDETNLLFVVDRCTYELGPVIGKGNDGQVLRAVNLETGKRVAVKIMRQRLNQDDNMSEVKSPPPQVTAIRFRITSHGYGRGIT